MSEATTIREPKKTGRAASQRQCVATTASGHACGRPPLVGGELCYAHDPEKGPRKPRPPRTGIEPLMTAKECAVLLGWTPAALYAAVRESRIPHVKIGRAVWFPRAAIDRWLVGAAKPASAG
jgi:excisionase family DNA binding protein